MRGYIIAICVLCLFNGCVCDCGPQSSGGSCGPTDAGSSGCNFDGGLVYNQPDVSTYTGDDGGPDATDDAEAGQFGICNGLLCPAGCSCDIVDDDAGGGVACECAGGADGGDAGDGGQSDATADAIAPDAASALDASDGATSTEAGAGDSGGNGDAGGNADASLDATTEAGEAIPCGVITCGAGCACVSVAASQCECP
jgi:hypothetical protein